jgi:D-alanyl-D-alanine carboxypeptidase
MFCRGVAFLCCAWISLLLLSCSSGSGAGPAFDPALAQKLQQSLTRSVQELGVPGAAMAVRAPDGSTWAGAAGYAQLPSASASPPLPSPQAGQKMAADMSFRIASSSKAFAATVLLQLVDEGKLSLDETVNDIIARWFRPGVLDFTIPYGDTMTLRNLLEMRSGMADYVVTPPFLALLAQQPPQKANPVDFVRWAVQSTNPAPAAPDTKMEYCNTNLILGGIIVEQVTGNPYPTELANRILTPLGLSHTFYPEDIALPAYAAHGYKFGDGELRDASDALDPSWLGAAGALISTAPDMLVWVKALNDGTLLSPATQAQRMILKPGVMTEGWPVDYGLGIYDDQGAVGHYGNYANIYTSYPMRYAGYDIAVLENGEITEQHEPGRHPARSIFWNAVRDMGL